MIYFFGSPNELVFAVQSQNLLNDFNKEKLAWLFGNQPLIESTAIENGNQLFIGPRKTMITPWSTNAVEITQNMGITGIQRIEPFEAKPVDAIFDYMLFQKYSILDQKIFEVKVEPEPIKQAGQETQAEDPNAAEEKGPADAGAEVLGGVFVVLRRSWPARSLAWVKASRAICWR